MVDYRESIRLKSTKPEMSNTMIVSNVGSSRDTVAEVWKLVQERGLSWPVPAILTDQNPEQIEYSGAFSITSPVLGNHDSGEWKSANTWYSMC